MQINHNRYSKVFFPFLFIGIWMQQASLAQCSSIDQSQLNYNAGMSARNLPQYTVWQDFTAGITGTFCLLDIGFFNPMTGTGTLNIFSGTGTGGALLQTQTVIVSGSGNFFQTFPVSVPVIAGFVYTFQFIPIQGGGIPDPYGVQVENPGSYSSGEMFITDPSGTYPTGFDMVFKTYVSSTTWVPEIILHANEFEIFSNSFLHVTVLRAKHDIANAALVIYSLQGQEVRVMKNISGREITIYHDNLRSGIYFIHLVRENGVTITGKLLITH